jgi:protein SCO1/2
MNFDRDIPNHRRRLLLLGGLLACGAVSRVGIALGAEHDMGARDDNCEDMHTGTDMHMDMHEHDDHHHHVMPQGISRSEARYEAPSVTLIRQDGAKVNFANELDDGRPVVLDFIYTSCTTICPLTSQIFYELQEKLGKERDKVKMVSVSIDPENDTPARLREYARKFHASAQWQHYTGTVAASVAVQKAFNVFLADKMEHSPVTFLRAAPGKQWVRLDGFASPDLLLAEYQHLLGTA